MSFAHGIIEVLSQSLLDPHGVTSIHHRVPGTGLLVPADEPMAIWHSHASLRVPFAGT